MKNKNNNIEKAITYDNTKSALGQLASTYREEYEELLSPVYSKEQLKDLDLDQLKDLLDEVIDRVYRVPMNEGGKPKPIQLLEVQAQIEAMSDEEKENLNFMLDALLNKSKDKK